MKPQIGGRRVLKVRIGDKANEEGSRAEGGGDKISLFFFFPLITIEESKRGIILGRDRAQSRRGISTQKKIILMGKCEHSTVGAVSRNSFTTKSERE